MLRDNTDQSVFMPGELTGGHHQLQLACVACHTDPLGGPEVLQEACIGCHGDARKKPQDSHPRTKFQDPRNADRLENIDALHCVTCHTEHRPEITLKNGVTQPADLCIHCHKDVAEERPSHDGMEFTTCASSGCHNFHNNRALYTNFLIKHLDEPELLAEPVVPAREFAQVLDQITDYPVDRYPLEPLSIEQADIKSASTDTKDENIHADWAASAHAQSGVNCSACHQPEAADGNTSAWTSQPDEQVCASCHSLEVERFTRGKHGMRLAAGLAPMSVGEARLPMREDASHKTLECNSCHAAHSDDVEQAAVQACLGCHNDTHTLAYEDSPHHQAWLKELQGEAPAGSGVSCATCHMPRIEFDINDWVTRVMVDHNQNANLSPNSKMIRTSCMQCHGLGFSLDSLADTELIQKNFTGKPSVHVETMDLAAAEKERRDQAAEDDDDTSMFGF
jgi:hypothetical protein